MDNLVITHEYALADIDLGLKVARANLGVAEQMGAEDEVARLTHEVENREASVQILQLHERNMRGAGRVGRCDCLRKDEEDL